MSLPPPSVPITTKAGMDFYLESAKFTRGFYARLREIKRIPGIANGLTSILKRSAYLNGKFTKVEDTITKTSKTADNIKKLNDAFYKKMPGGGTPQNAGALGGQLIFLVMQGGLAAAVIHSTLVQNGINDIVDKQLLRLGLDGSKILTTLGTIKSRVDNVKKDLENTVKQITKNNIDVDRLSKDFGGLERNTVKAREAANNALYETRQGRKIVEDKIAIANKQSNDALYETRQGRKVVDEKINNLQQQVNRYLSGVNQNFQQQISTTVTTLQKGLQEAQLEAKVANEKVASLNTLISNIQSSAQEAITTAKNVTATVATIPATIAKQVSAVEQTTRTYVERRFVEEKFADRNYIQETIVPSIQTVARGTTGVAAEVGALKQDFSKAERSINQIPDLSARVAFTQTKTNQITGEVEKIKSDISTVKTDLTKIDTGLREQEKVNQQAIPKLDYLTGLVALIPARAANAIRPDIPTIPQIENATATGVCKSTQPGGCMNKALNDNASQINANTNNKVKDALDVLNTGANAAQLTLLNTINTKIGAQLPEGLSGTFGRLWNTLQVDRVLNILTLITVFHNALMLSNNIAQTLFAGIDNVAQSIGFKWKNEKGEEAGFGSIVSEWTANFFKTIFGAENFTNLTNAYKAANRIYQSGTNILFSVQSMLDMTRSITELAANNTGKIGNALKRAGAVFENAFPDMSEFTTARTAQQAKWDNVLQGLQPIENAVSAFSQVTGEVVSIGDNFNQLKGQKEEFEKSKKDGEDAIKKLVGDEKTASAVTTEIGSSDVRRSE
ncbi:MAG: hypothetical protein KME40_32010 [Komarekiella atlantica HA4396-MV6]|jgi:predicted  nucleic acid-binding Zn-ribbon protein|nr:hypothetical protein [Komarekiella atlantica HA4396-MV6]